MNVEATRHSGGSPFKLPRLAALTLLTASAFGAGAFGDDLEVTRIDVSIAAGEFLQVPLPELSEPQGQHHWVFADGDTVLDHSSAFLELIDSPDEVLIDAHYAEGGVEEFELHALADEADASSVIARVLLALQVVSSEQAALAALPELERAVQRPDGRWELRWAPPPSQPLVILADDRPLDTVYGNGYISDDALESVERLRFVRERAEGDYEDLLAPLDLGS